MRTSKSAEPICFDREALTARIRRGDPAGVEDLHRHLGRGVRFLAKRKLPPSQVEGCVREVFNRVIAGLRSGALGESAWLVQYVYEQLTNHIRELRERRPLREDAFSAACQPRATEEHRQVIERLLPRLSPAERRSLARFYVEGSDDRSTRRELGIPAAEFRALRASVRFRFREMCGRGAAAAGTPLAM